MILYALLIYTWSVNGYTTQVTHYQSQIECDQDSQIMTVELDRMNETSILGYAINCVQTTIQSQ